MPSVERSPFAPFPPFERYCSGCLGKHHLYAYTHAHTLTSCNILYIFNHITYICNLYRVSGHDGGLIVSGPNILNLPQHIMPGNVTEQWHTLTCCHTWSERRVLPYRMCLCTVLPSQRFWGKRVCWRFNVESHSVGYLAADECQILCQPINKFGPLVMKVRSGGEGGRSIQVDDTMGAKPRKS